MTDTYIQKLVEIPPSCKLYFQQEPTDNFNILYISCNDKITYLEQFVDIDLFSLFHENKEAFLNLFHVYASKIFESIGQFDSVLVSSCIIPQSDGQYFSGNFNLKKYIYNSGRIEQLVDDIKNKESIYIQNEKYNITGRKLTINEKVNQVITDIRPLVRIGNSLESLTLRLSNVYNLDLVSMFSNLKKLTINAKNLVSLNFLTKLTNLEELNLLNVPTVNFSFLLNMEKLTKLYVKNSDILETRYICINQSLKELYLINVRDKFSRDNLDIDFILGLENLEVLDLSLNKVIDLKFLQSCQFKLKILYLNNNYIDNPQLLEIFKEIETLDLSFTNINDLRQLKGMTKLKELYLSSGANYDKSAIPKSVSIEYVEPENQEDDLYESSGFNNFQFTGYKPNSYSTSQSAEDFSFENIEMFEKYQKENNQTSNQMFQSQPSSFNINMPAFPSPPNQMFQSKASSPSSSSIMRI
uniref:Uncharacterized protein n=1 Tax=viral metagenome TaxID=1070528 RepID=A0A6C0BD49_9ZZZZ